MKTEQVGSVCGKVAAKTLVAASAAAVKTHKGVVSFTTSIIAAAKAAKTSFEEELQNNRS